MEGFFLRVCDDQIVDLLRGFYSDFNKDDVDDCVESDVLDFNRILLVDIFKVFDFLNFSILFMKFLIFIGERLRIRRVQLVGYI